MPIFGSLEMIVQVGKYVDYLQKVAILNMLDALLIEPEED